MWKDFNQKQSDESRFVTGPDCCRHVCTLFSAEILQAGETKGLNGDDWKCTSLVAVCWMTWQNVLTGEGLFFRQIVWTRPVLQTVVLPGWSQKVEPFPHEQRETGMTFPRRWSKPPYLTLNFVQFLSGRLVLTPDINQTFSFRVFFMQPTWILVMTCTLCINIIEELENLLTSGELAAHCYRQCVHRLEGCQHPYTLEGSWKRTHNCLPKDILKREFLG